MAPENPNDRTHEHCHICRVGAHLAVGPPPGTVRAPLDAYGSTSETAERHIFQRGLGCIPLVPGAQRLVRPLQHQTEIIPVIVPPHAFRRDVVDLHRGRILQRQPGDGAAVLLPFQEVTLEPACFRQGASKQGLRSPFLPVRRQPGVEGTVRPFDLMVAQPVETRMGQQRDQSARRSVRRGHVESLAVDPRVAVVSLRGCHRAVPATRPFTEGPQCPVG